jgi:site-specific DNA recombinase
MPSANGHDLKRAILWVILYARVSTQEQAEKGFSIRQQLERGRQWCADEGYRVLAEITDAGQSGATLERPGLDEIRDIVVQGSVAFVWAQDADRITRDPIHRAFLDDEMEQFGTRLVALDDWGDDSHEGELLRYMKGWVSKGERLKTAERTRRGKLRKAQEGKVIAAKRPHYGFCYNEARDNYVVEEGEISVVARIFRMVGFEGVGIRGVKRTFEREGMPTPEGKRHWG